MPSQAKDLTEIPVLRLSLRRMENKASQRLRPMETAERTKTAGELRDLAVLAVNDASVIARKMRDVANRIHPEGIEDEMSQVADVIHSLIAKVDALTAQVGTAAADQATATATVASLKAQVDSLTAQVAAGVLDAADVQALADAKAVVTPAVQ